ncbi:hypothetical protein N9A28_03520 [Sulfurimonas sp.]|nr:hypothetical protein [Sulfurimonas sp.]
MKISLATKVLWILIIGYIIIMFLLSAINVDSPLPELMAENFGLLFFVGLGLQFIIYIVNKFIAGGKEFKENSK